MLPSKIRQHLSGPSLVAGARDHKRQIIDLFGRLDQMNGIATSALATQIYSTTSVTAGMPQLRHEDLALVVDEGSLTAMKTATRSGGETVARLLFAYYSSNP